jgi:DNA repair photolyase
LDFRGHWNNEKPAISNLSKIKKIISVLPKNTVIRIGSMTDCFQPLELKEKRTYEIIKLLNKCKINYLIVTKGAIVANDEYLKIYDHDLAHFQITITNTDDNQASKHEKASPTSKRIESIERLFNLGHDVSIRLSPFIEGFIDFDILNSINCDKILIEFLKINHFIKKWLKIDYSDYMVEYGGYRHLPLYKKLILIRNITGFKEISVGEYVKDHHEYFKQNINFNKNDCCNLNIKFKAPTYTQLNLF